MCMGCGSCASDCPAEAIALRHFMAAQINNAVCRLLNIPEPPEPVPEEMPLLERVGVAQNR
ncbi:MAG: hypothetical protein GXP31_01545, partial [Kiritimatiellaeota bacterium]|nr:hypothetical protein [Kiritimatiellota bacterium]